MFKTYDVPESPKKATCVRYTMNRNRQSGGRGAGWGGVLKTYGEPDSPKQKMGRRLRYMVRESPKLKDGACVRYMAIRNRTMRGVFRICDES